MSTNRKLTEAQLDAYEAEKQAMYDELISAQSSWQSQWNGVELPDQDEPMFADSPVASAIVAIALGAALIAVIVSVTWGVAP